MRNPARLPFYYSLFVLFLLPCLLHGQEYELVEEATLRELPGLELGRAVLQIHLDKDGLLWYATEEGLYRYDGTETKAFLYNPNKAGGLAGNWIGAIVQDSKGHFFIGVFGMGLQKFTPETEQFTLISPEPIDSSQVLNPRISKIVIDFDSTVWIVTQKGLWRYFPKSNTSKYYLGLIVEIDKNGDIWGVNKEGIYFFNKAIDQFELFYEIKREIIDNKQGGELTISSFGDLFFCSHDNVMFCFSPSTKAWKEYSLDFEGLIRDIKETSEEQLVIINTLDEFGMNIFDLKSQTFKKVHFDETVSDQIWGTTYPFCYNKNIFVNGRSASGTLNVLKTTSSFAIRPKEGESLYPGSFSINNLPDGRVGFSYHLGLDIENKMVQNLAETYPALKEIQTPNDFFNHDKWYLDEDGKYWICTSFSDQGTNSYNIYYFDPSTQKLIKKGSIDKYFGPILGEIIKDDNGYIWIGTWRSLIKFHPQEDTYEVVNPDIPTTGGNGIIYGAKDLFKDSDGDIWVGTQNGLYQYDNILNKFTHYVNSPEDTTSLSYNSVHCITEDTTKTLWVGTGYGLNAFNKKTKKFTRHYFKGDKNKNENRIVSIEVDGQNIWFASSKRLNKYNPKLRSLDFYDTANGLINDEFIEEPSLKLKNGNLLFAGNKGIDIINPKTLQKNQHIPPIKITGFSLSNEEVEILGADSILKKSIVYTKSITLNHDQNVFSFRFAALDYTAPEKNEYAYQMVGFDDDWQYIGNRSEATFTNLDPGTYTFKVKGSNNDGIWNEEGTSLSIVIHPPWYWSWWTKSLYGFLFFGFLYSLYRFQLSRRLAENESLRLKELDDAKNQLYTNITHDFRTPLTIIQGMTEQIKSKQYTQEKNLIQRNTQKLLHMVNQILDLAKLEAGKLNLQLQQSDIVIFLKNEMTAYVALATSQNIDLQFHCETEEMEMDFDPFLLRQVLANLLSNALKFIAEDGKIIVRTQRIDEAGSPQLLLTVEDTGKGISPDQLDKIFDRYYQVQDTQVYSTLGTGIGLAHTKELVALMGGKVSVKSELGVGSTFSFTLPVTHKAVKVSSEEITSAYVENAVIIQQKPSKQVAIVENVDLPLVLIVEDNEDVIQYLIRCLQENYRILTALNGAEGIKTALEHIPDLIVSDVMMPEVDGFSLTEQLKNDERSSHIPIILLTAKADQQAKITGLQSGADAYLYKPFDRQEMLVRLEKLLELRKNLQQRYASPDQLELVSGENLSIDEQFLKNVQTFINQHLDDADYSVEQLAKDVHLSRTQLFRKVKALTNESVSAYMRLIRLTQAKKLLQSNQFTVSEVAYQVGFSDPAYFSRCFSALFGFPPSEVG